MTIFRVDFDEVIGMGHLMRSLVFAKRFEKVVYVSKSNRKEFVPYELITIENEEAFFDYVEKLQPSQVVVDDYNFTFEHEKAFKRRFSDIKLIVFDDDYRNHFCDEIINHNISADKRKYPKPDIVTLIPPLIRDEFLREKKIKREKIYDLFIAMGGSDTGNLNIPILEVLPENLRVAVVTTSANGRLSTLKKYVKNRKNVILYIDSNEMAKLMNQSRFAIVAPSVIVHEVMFMELPFLAFKTADNQNDIVKYLQQKDFHVCEKFDPKTVEEEVCKRLL